MSVIYRDSQHEKRFAAIFARMQSNDEYHMAAAYLLALDPVCHEHAAEVFDFDADIIIPDALCAAWQTGTSGKTTRLLFSLWSGFCYDDADSETPSALYSPESLFSCDYMEYYFQAIRLRFPCYAIS